MKGLLVALAVGGAMVVLPAVAAADVWEPVSGTPLKTRTAYVQPDRFHIVWSVKNRRRASHRFTIEGCHPDQ
ncbi:MAG: hypothetical protein ACRDJV_12615 [Actinomycetota bacterium]